MSAARVARLFPEQLRQELVGAWDRGVRRMKGGSWAAVVAKGLRREGEEDDLIAQLEADTERSEKTYRKVQMNRVPLPNGWFDSRTTWTELVAGLFCHKQHINLSEMDALMTAVRILVRLPEAHNSKVLSLSDSQVVVGATAKGRSSSRGLARKLRRLNALLLACKLDLGVRFVQTLQNPADESSRRIGRRLLAESGLH